MLDETVGPEPVAAVLPSPKSSDQVAIEPSESVLVEPLKVTGSGPLPDDGLTDRCATGGTFARAVTEIVAGELETQLSSLTVKFAVQLPAEYWCWTPPSATPVSSEETLAPSPNASVQDAITPSASELADPSKVTVSGAFPLAGVGLLVRTAVGAWSGLT